MAERYIPIKKIGGGGFANVYQAIDIKTGNVVAKKELLVPNTENRKRLRRERDIYLEQAQNRFIIDLLDSEVNGPAPYLILKYAPLGSLQQFVTNRQDWKRIVHWFSGVVVGLSPIYQSGGFHGDPKPSNFLLFQENDLVVITDFGLAQRPNPSSGPMTNSPRGTLRYMDPALNNGGPYTWRHDIYALGKSMRELLTGNTEKSWLIGVPGPAELGQLIDRMTDPNPLTRPNVQDIFQTLRGLINPKQVPGQESSGGKVLLFGLVAAAIAYATSNNYDSNVGRFRNNKGQFAKGRWG